MAIDFDGVTDRLDYTSGIADISGFTNLTIALRVNRDAGSAGNEYVLNWEASGVVKHLLWFDASEDLRWTVTTSGTQVQRIASVPGVADGVWTPVVITHVGMSMTNTDIAIYTNNNQVGDSGINGTGTVATVNQLRIAGRSGDDLRNFDSKFADLVVADTIWSAGEIAAYSVGRRSGWFFPRGRTNQMPLIRSIHDVVGDDPGSADGTLVFPHPPIIRPTPAQTAFIAAAAGNAGLLQYMNSHHQMAGAA